MMESSKDEQWDLVIQPKNGRFELNLREVWQYRTLLEMYIKREIVTTYKQTILGPVWFFIQPVFTTIVFMFVFGGLAGISTDGLPPVLFYLSGITFWNYFSDSLIKTSDTFITNQAIFGKVYFPRIVVPLSITITGLVKMCIQFFVFFIVYVYYALKGAAISPNIYALLLPVLILILGSLSLGLGIIISSFTTKYRDLKFLIAFGIQLLMYGTPVIYPLSLMKENYKEYLWVVQANPLTAIIEAFKYGFLGQGTFTWLTLGYSAVISILILVLGIFIFNKTERNFIDVI